MVAVLRVYVGPAFVRADQTHLEDMQLQTDKAIESRPKFVSEVLKLEANNPLVARASRFLMN